VALLVDDADRLRGDALDQLLRLSRAAGRRPSGLHLVLAGEPVLQERLRRARGAHPGVAGAQFTRLSRLRVREAATLLKRLVAHRLSTSDTRFSPPALRRIVELSHGLPGRIVGLFETALKGAEQVGEKLVSPARVDHAAALMAVRPVSPEPPPRSATTMPSGESELRGAAAVDGREDRPQRWRLPVSWQTLFVPASRRTLFVPGSMVVAVAVAVGTGAYLGGATDRPLINRHVESMREAPLAVERVPAPVSSPVPTALSLPSPNAAPFNPRNEAASQAAVRVDSASSSQTERTSGGASSIELAHSTPDLKLTAGAGPVDHEPLQPIGVTGEAIRADLERAWAAYDRNALTTPREDNARKWAESVLAASPGTPEAIEVLQAVVDKYLQWSENNLTRRNFYNASNYLDKAKSLSQHAAPEQVAVMGVLDAEIATRQRRLAEDRAKQNRKRQSQGRHVEGPQWIKNIDSWLRTLPLPRDN
ncbi:MAG: hypothetical protein ACR2RL_15810, partial [Gammaproteobacteria bacterium]